MEEKRSVEELLKNNITVQFHPRGDSMWPLFVSPEDYAIVEPLHGELKRADVAVYRDAGGKLVIHRVWKATREGVRFVGDHCMFIEPLLPYDNIYGKMVGFIRRNKEYSVNNFAYGIYARVWLFLRPFRGKIIYLGHIIKVIFGKKHK